MRKFVYTALGVAAALSAVAFAQSSRTITEALPPAININYLLPIPPAGRYTLYNMQATQILYKPLLWVDKNVQIDYARSIAESVSTTNGQTYTIKLNPKWHWSDGTPVTAKDVVFDVNLIKSINGKNSSKYGGWGIGGIPNSIRSVKVVSPTELTITLNSKYNKQWFEYNGLAQLIPLPAQAWNKYPNDPAKTLAYLQKNGDNIAFFKQSPVDGPFVVGQFNRNRSFSFVPNPHYDGHKASYGKLIMRYYTSSDAEFNALKAGEVQVGYLPTHLYAERNLSGYTFASTPRWNVDYIYLNFANPHQPAIRDLAVRQALQMAVDQPGMLKALFHNQGNRAYGPVPYIPDTYLSPYLKSTVPYPYNPAKGRAILEKAGWRMKNGLMTKGNEQLSFTLKFASGTLTRKEQAEIIKEAAAKEGIRITLGQEPFDTLLGDLSNPSKWTLIYYGGWIYVPDYYPTGYGLFNTLGGSNQQDYSNSQMDVYTILTHAYFQTKRQSLNALFRYENYAAEQLPLIWLPNLNLLHEISNQVTGALEHINPTGNWSPQYWNYK